MSSERFYFPLPFASDQKEADNTAKVEPTPSHQNSSTVRSTTHTPYEIKTGTFIKSQSLQYLQRLRTVFEEYATGATDQLQCHILSSPAPAASKRQSDFQLLQRNYNRDIEAAKDFISDDSNILIGTIEGDEAFVKNVWEVNCKTFIEEFLRSISGGIDGPFGVRLPSSADDELFDWKLISNADMNITLEYANALSIRLSLKSPHLRSTNDCELD
ncbi:hypothetical protein DFH27DRAFT_544914 [Peziza echinospora]|nr:hypothetical protein DFH27DRAFT_544914 [Peziza echinospora]